MMQILMQWIYDNAVEGTRSCDLLADVLTANSGMIRFLSLIARETGVHIIAAILAASSSEYAKGNSIFKRKEVPHKTMMKMLLQ